MNSVLITAIGSFSAEAAIRAARSLGLTVYGCDINDRRWIAQSGLVDRFFRAPYASEEDCYIDFINDTGADFVLPSTDTEVDVLSRRRDDLKGKLLISDRKAIEVCRDKMKWAEYAGKIGLAIPSEYLEDCEMPAGMPVIVKPVNGRSSIGFRKIGDTAEYTFVRDRLLAEGPGRYMVQPFIEGDLITVDVVRDPYTGMSEALPRQELLRTPNGAGTSVRVFRDKDIEAAAAMLAEGLDITGTVCIEFLRTSSGRFFTLECNPRFSGGIAFSVRAGYDFARAHFTCFGISDADSRGFRTAIPAMPAIPETYIARMYGEYVIE